jgi:hypothetical protein
VSPVIGLKWFARKRPESIHKLAFNSDPSQPSELGVLIALEEPTKAMMAEAAAAGFYKCPWGNHPRLQSALDIFAKLKMPKEHNEVLTQLEKANGEASWPSHPFLRLGSEVIGGLHSRSVPPRGRPSGNCPETGFWEAKSRRGFRVPGVYFASATSRSFAILTNRRINSLRGFNRAFSPIPTAPTNHPIC